MELFGLLDAAERAARRKPRVLGRHAPAMKVVLEQREMGCQLTRKPVLGSAGEHSVEDPHE